MKKRLTFSFRTLETKPWYRWVVFVVVNLAFTLGVMFVSLGLIVPDIMRDFAIEAREIGLLLSAYSYVYAFMQIPAGFMADKVGPRRVMSFFLAVGAIGMILFSQAQNFSVGMVARVLIALGVSVLYVNKVKVLRGWFSTDEFATAMGLGSSVGSVSRLLAGPFLAILIAEFGWRTTYAGVGCLNLIFAAICWIVIRDRNPALVDQWQKTASETPKLSTMQAIKTCLGNRQFVGLFFVALLSYGGMMGGFGSWGTPFLMQGYGMSRVNAALLLTGTAIFSLFSGPIWGHISDKRLRARKPVLIIGLLAGVLFTLPLATMAGRLTIPIIAILLILSSTLGSARLLSYTMVNDQVPASIAGIAIACLNIGPYIGGGLYESLSGFILGSPSYISEGTPVYSVDAYQSVFAPSLIAAVVAVIIALLLKESMRTDDETSRATQQ